MHMLLQDVQPQGGVMRADLIPPQYIFLLMDDALGCHRERNQPRAVSRSSSKAAAHRVYECILQATQQTVPGMHTAKAKEYNTTATRQVLKQAAPTTTHHVPWQQLNKGCVPARFGCAAALLINALQLYRTRNQPHAVSSVLVKKAAHRLYECSLQA